MLRIIFPPCVLLILIFILSSLNLKRDTTRVSVESSIITGADQVELYVPLLKGKRVGMMVNQTSIIGKKSIVDSLLSLNIKIKTIFGPEHGFRSNASNGAAIKDEIDEKTGIPIISLYGKKRKPSKQDMDSIDVMIFDIQDVVVASIQI